jgi:putative hydrolase of the HAD superfamily
MRFEAVAFDLDGTLYPAARLNLIAFPSMLGKARALLAFNEARQATRELARSHGTAARDGASFRALEAELTARRLGKNDSEAFREVAAMIDRDFYRGIEELFSRLKPYRGVPEALNELSRGGLRLALLSDLPPSRKLELLGLDGRFEVALCSEDSGSLKPARAPFDMLCSRMGLAPEKVLYVGNSARYDVHGAKAAGMSAAIVARRRVSEADLSFWDWRALVDFALADR